MYLAYKKDNLNKMLFIVLISFFIVLILSSSCFSYDILDKNNSTYTIPDYFKQYKYILYKEVVGSYYLYFSNEPLVVKYVNDRKLYCVVSENGSKIKKIGSTWRLDRLFSTYSVEYIESELIKEESFSPLDSNISSILSSVIFSVNVDIYDKDNNLVLEGCEGFKYPGFLNSKEELEGGNFSLLKIASNDFKSEDDEFLLNIYDVYDAGNNIYIDYIKKSFLLNRNSSYNEWVDLNSYYYIPSNKLSIDFTNGKRYKFELKERNGDTVYSLITFTIGGLTKEEEEKNAQDYTNEKLDEQTQAIKDSNETNKNIFERIGDLLSYINPFSENFFVYKLIELLVDAIKGLFIPSNDFFSTYFTNLKDWFSDRLGFLFYPFELIIDILTKILNINFSEPIFNIPDLVEPFTGNKIMNATTFNLNSIVESGIFKTIHDIYLVCVDAFVTFELVNLFKRKYEEVTTK